jgi:cysteine-rich repeat protein
MSGSRARCFDLVISLLLLGSANVAHALPPNLVSHWKADGDAADSGPAVNHGTLVGGASFAAGQYGQAFSFDGVDDRVALGTSTAFRQSGAITYSFWANMPAGGGGFVMGAGGLGGHGYGGLFLNNNAVQFAWTPTTPNNDTFATISGLGVSPGNWVHIALSVDFSAQSLTYYVNGVAQPAGSIAWVPAPPANWLPTASFSSGQPDSLGARFVNSFLFFNGLLDDIQIYSRALSASEVEEVRQSGLPQCGDGEVAGAEECDDGNLLAGDGCRSDCTAEVCGDLILDPQEQCDDGNVISGDGCQANCALPICSDGVVDPGQGEECDDGNLAGGDGCSDTCHVEVCGNGTVDPAEQCDDGNATVGDGCRPDCTQELCGDGLLDPQEQCDDANNTPGDGCRANCTIERCGDNSLDPQEQCDDGNVISGDGCQANCALPICGDAIQDPGEQCDDGNLIGGDGCSASCQPEECANGILDPLEQCDDGNLSAGDGCRGNCTIEICGDGLLDPQEQCDDGNATSGDGCSAACQIETTGGGQGCTPGYWKQEHHFDSWPAPYTPDMPFASVFENAFPNQSLRQVLQRTGGGLDALGRHAVAALLNGASSGVSYDLMAPEVIQMFDQTYPGTKDAYTTLKDNFASFNEQVCPLD